MADWEWRGLIPLIWDIIILFFDKVLGTWGVKIVEKLVAFGAYVGDKFEKALAGLFVAATGPGHLAGVLSIFVLIGLVFGGGFAFWKMSIRPPNVKVPKYQSPFAKYMNSYFTPSYKTSLFFKNLTPYSGEEKSVDRPSIIGRCDNLTMREASIGGAGLCMNTTTPEPIKWIIDPDTMPELNDLHPSIKSTAVGDKYTVSIPYTVYQQDGMNYYPDCSKATFADGTSASYLFEDNGTSTCNRRKITRETHTQEARPISISPEYSGLATYATENNPLCK